MARDILETDLHDVDGMLEVFVKACEYGIAHGLNTIQLAGELMGMAKFLKDTRDDTDKTLRHIVNNPKGSNKVPLTQEMVTAMAVKAHESVHGPIASEAGSDIEWYGTKPTGGES